jgi:hypothetical protein
MHRCELDDFFRDRVRETRRDETRHERQGMARYCKPRQQHSRDSQTTGSSKSLLVLDYTFVPGKDRTGQDRTSKSKAFLVRLEHFRFKSQKLQAQETLKLCYQLQHLSKRQSIVHQFASQKHLPHSLCPPSTTASILSWHRARQLPYLPPRECTTSDCRLARALSQ